MNINLFVTLLSMLFVLGEVQAQKISQKGNLSALKDAGKIQLVYDYDKMRVGKYVNEEEYIKERVAQRNQKEPGGGDKWKAAWYDDRERRFEPKFDELFNKYVQKYGLEAGKDYTDAPVKAIVRTTFTEPGFNVGVVRRSASIDAVIIFVDNKTGKELGKLTALKVPGKDAMGYDFDTGVRIQEAYALLGKATGKYLAKKVLK